MRWTSRATPSATRGPRCSAPPSACRPRPTRASPRPARLHRLCRGARLTRAGGAQELALHGNPLVAPPRAVREQGLLAMRHNVAAKLARRAARAAAAKAPPAPAPPAPGCGARVGES